MATTIKGLKTAFKKAEHKISKAVARYKNLLFKLYMPAYPNCRKSDMSKDYADVYLTCINSDGSIREYATNLSWTFYRKCRGGKFYEKPQNENKKHCDACDQPCYLACPYRHSENLVSQDYLDLRKLEYAINAAIEERENIINALESLDCDVYHDSALWE